MAKGEVKEYYTFSTEGLTERQIEFLSAVEKLFFEGAEIDLELRKKALDVIGFKNGEKDAAGIIEAWSYWFGFSRPFLRDSYKHPVKLSSLIVMTTKDKGKYIQVRDSDNNDFKSGYCVLDPVVLDKLDMLEGSKQSPLTTYLEVVNNNLYISYSQIIGGRFIAVVDNDVPELQLTDKMEKGGEVGKTATVLVISDKHPLSTQLQKLTGDSWNMNDFEDLTAVLNLNNPQLIRHKKTGKLFVVYQATYYMQVDKHVIADDLSWLKRNYDITNFENEFEKKEKGGEVKKHLTIEQENKYGPTKYIYDHSMMTAKDHEDAAMFHDTESNSNNISGWNRAEIEGKRQTHRNLSAEHERLAKEKGSDGSWKIAYEKRKAEAKAEWEKKSKRYDEIMEIVAAYDKRLAAKYYERFNGKPPTSESQLDEEDRKEYREMMALVDEVNNLSATMEKGGSVKQGEQKFVKYDPNTNQVVDREEMTQKTANEKNETYRKNGSDVRWILDKPKDPFDTSGDEEYYEKGGEINGGQGAVNGFFSSDGKHYVNLGVSKSSPNRIGKVIGLNYGRSGDEELEFAEVQFRDFKENIRFNREEASEAPYPTFSPKGLTKRELKFLLEVEKLYLAGAEVDLDLFKKALEKVGFKKDKATKSLIEAWDYWQSFNRPIFRESYKNPISLKSLITMTDRAIMHKGGANGVYYISAKDSDTREHKSGHCFIKHEVYDKLDLLSGLTIYLEVINDYLYVKYNEIIGSKLIAVVKNDVPELQLTNKMEKGGSVMTKDDAIKAAEEAGVDFDKDFHAQSYGHELSELAKKCGYKKPKNANGSTGRYFFHHLRKIRDKAKKNKPKLYATYNEYGYEIWDTNNNLKYSAGNSPYDSQGSVELEEAAPLETLKKYAERTGKEIAAEEKMEFVGAQYEKREMGDEFRVFENGGSVAGKLLCVIIANLKTERSKGSLKGKFGIVDEVINKNNCDIIIGGKEIMMLDIEDFAIVGSEVSFIGNKKYDKGVILSFNQPKKTAELFVPSGEHIHVHVMMLKKVIGERETLLKSIEAGKIGQRNPRIDIEKHLLGE